jgi:hypothetical protein
MKLTKEVLNKIINEEIEKSINEGFLDKIKRTFGSDEYVPLPWGNKEEMMTLLRSGHTSDLSSDHPNAKKFNAVKIKLGNMVKDRFSEQGVDLGDHAPHYFGDALRQARLDTRTGNPIYDHVFDAYERLWTDFLDSPQAKNLSQEMDHMAFRPEKLQAVRIRKLNKILLDAFEEWGRSYVDELDDELRDNMARFKRNYRDAEERRKKERARKNRESDAALGASNCKEVREKCRQKHYTKDYYRAAPAHQRTVERNYEDCVKENGC